MDESTIGDIREIVDIPLGGKKNVILDSQVLTTIMSCPCLGDFRFNLNLQSIDGKSNSLECGSIAHVFMEYFYRGIIHGFKREQAVQLGFTAAETYIRGCADCTDFVPSTEILKPTCGHKANEFPGVKNTPRESVITPYPRIGWQWVLDTCDQYQQYYRNDHWVPLEVEVVKGKVLYEDDEIRILWKAKLDLVTDTNQGIFPEDHKTMKQRRDNISLNNQFIGQCLVMGTQKMVINKIGFQTTLKPEEKFTRTMMGYSVPRLLEWQGEILPFYAKLLLMYAETGHWPRNFTHCEGKYGNCAFVKVCEADPIMREDVIKQMFIVGPAWNPTNDEE
jgi:hypothetical protein